MRYKSSKFNYITESQNGGIIIYNSYRGLESVHRIDESIKEEIADLLDNTTDIDINSDIKSKLVEHGFLVPMNVDEYKKLQLLYLKSINNRVLSLVILPTEKCNYRCKYCYESFERGAMLEEVQEGIISFVSKNIHNYSSLSVSWFGGEPLMEMPIIEDLSLKLMKICNQHHKPYIANVTTNGYLLTPEVLKKLIKLKVTHYMITIDGVKRTHDDQKPLVNGKGSYDTVIKNLIGIKNTVKSRMFNITIRTNFTKDMFPYTEEYVDTFYEHFGDDSRFLFFIRPAGDWGGDRVKDFSKQLFDKNSFSQVFERVLSHEKSLNFSRHLSFLQPCGSMCPLSSINSYLFDAEGNVRKCSCDLDSDDNIIGKIDKSGDLHIDDNLQAKWTHYFELSKKCKDCHFAPTCLDNSCLANYAVNRNTDGQCHVYEREYLDYILKLCENTEKIEVL